MRMLISIYIFSLIVSALTVHGFFTGICCAVLQTLGQNVRILMKPVASLIGFCCMIDTLVVFGIASQVSCRLMDIGLIWKLERNGMH
jgi:hypothetical protein